MILSEMLTKVLLPDQSKWPVLFGFLAALGDILPMAAVIVLFTRMEPMKFILNGVCLGSCVSGGFAMLIFVGYLFTLDLDFSSGTVYLDIVFVRHFINNILMSVCLLNCGALIGGGLRDASDDPAFRFTALKDLRFLRWAGTAYVLLVVYYVNNTMWNSVILRLIVIAVSAAAVLIQIAAGQRQCVRVCHSTWDREAAEDEETEEEE